VILSAPLLFLLCIFSLHLQLHLFSSSPNVYHWKQLGTKGESPDARNFHSSFVHFGRLFVLGGRSMAGQVISLDHVYILNLDTLLWSKVQTRGTPPRPSLLWSAVKNNNRVWLFGGTIDGQVMQSI